MQESYAQRKQHPPILESVEIVIALVLMALVWFAWSPITIWMLPPRRSVTIGPPPL
jgi:hypothetical protein